MNEVDQTKPPQSQGHQPGKEHKMRPEPQCMPCYPSSGRLSGNVALITGGDSGIGRAVAVLFAREGAKIGIVYLEETEDAKKTQDLVEAEGSSALCVEGDIADEAFCRRAVEMTIDRFGRLDVLVNNAAEQHPQSDLEDLTAEQLERTYRTNVFGYYHMTKAALPHLGEGGRIINTSSVTAYPRQLQPSRLQRDKGSHRHLYVFPGAGARRSGDSCQRCRAWPHLDTSDALEFRGGEGRQVRQEVPDGTTRRTQRGGAELSVPGLR
jgi:NAD(P)-dependent dehydrogenase (short-subunit alcohol dehydrogenase family)